MPAMPIAKAMCAWLRPERGDVLVARVRMAKALEPV
jgi:hypothetical protein